MNDLETWIARGVVSAIVAACVGLFVRVRRLESASAVISKSLGDLETRDTGVGSLGARMETVERGLVKRSTALESLPDAREFAALGRSVTAVQGEIAALPRDPRRRGQDDGRPRQAARPDQRPSAGRERMSRAADAARTSTFKAGPGAT